MKLDLSFEQNKQNINVHFAENGGQFNANFGEFQYITEYVGGEPYEGEYQVTPKVSEQILPTKQRVMLDNLTVLSIPYFETSNNSGGNTVYIAKET